MFALLETAFMKTNGGHTYGFSVLIFRLFCMGSQGGGGVTVTDLVVWTVEELA